MKASNETDKLKGISKLIIRRKVADIRRYTMERIEQAVKSGRSLKAVKAYLCLGKN